MKKQRVFLAMLAFTLVLGLAFMGCKSGVDDPSEPDDPLNGTWRTVVDSVVADIILDNGSFTMANNGAVSTKGRYITYGNTITMTITHMDLSIAVVGFQGDVPTGWITISEAVAWLSENGFAQQVIDALTTPWTGTVNGDTLTLGDTTYTRQ